MPQTGPAAEAFGAVTIALVSPFVVLAALCIFYTAHFRRQIQKQTLLQLGYFNGPWATRIAFSSVAIWWSIWEIIRLSLLRISGSPLSESPPWQKHTCKFYIVSNVGFAEPAMLFIMIFLLRASLQRKELGALSRHWNGKTISWAILLSVPVFILQLGIVFLGPSVLNRDNHVRVKLAAYFWSSWSSTDAVGNGGGACTYPLFSTALLGFLDLGLLIYASCAGAKILSLAVNRRLRRRIGVFIVLVDVLLVLRIVFLSLSVLPAPGGAAFEALVFLAFLAQLVCMAAAVSVLVFYPVSDSLAIREAVGFDLEEVPFDDYYGDAARLMANNQSLVLRLEPDRSSDVSTKRGSISFRTMI
ncbi:plasminogen activator inhibitor [Wolffia australiana]